MKTDGKDVSGPVSPVQPFPPHCPHTGTTAATPEKEMASVTKLVASFIVKVEISYFYMF